MVLTLKQENNSEATTIIDGRTVVADNEQYLDVYSSLNDVVEQLQLNGFVVKVSESVNQDDTTVSFSIPYSRTWKPLSSINLQTQISREYNDPASSLIRVLQQTNLTNQVEQLGNYIFFDPNTKVDNHTNGAKGRLLVLLPPSDDTES